MVFFSIFSIFFKVNKNIITKKTENFSKSNFESFDFQSFYNFYNFFKKEQNYFKIFFENINSFVFTNSVFFNFFFFSYWIYKNFLFFAINTIFFIFFKINKILNLKNIKYNINNNIIFTNSKVDIKIKENKNKFKVYLNNKFKLYYLNNIFENTLIFLRNYNKNLIIFKKLNNYFIKFNNYFIMKFLKNYDINKFQIFFLRKNRTFNKGRYSRNRQNFRTGVYWCLYVNILAVLGIYFFFYKFTINFGYLWWLLIFFINCFFFNKFFKINFMSFNKLYFFLKKLFFWYCLILFN